MFTPLREKVEINLGVRQKAGVCFLMFLKNPGDSSGCNQVEDAI
jgi:hypothetical protein